MRGIGPDLALAKVLIQGFLTLANSTGDILYYLLAVGTESASKSIFYFLALAGGVLGGARISLNSLQINSKLRGQYLALILSPPPILPTSPWCPVVSEGVTNQTIQDSHVLPQLALVQHL